MRRAAPLILLALASAAVAQAPATRPAGEARLAALVDQLDDRDPEVRLAARSALMSLDRAALPELRNVVAGTAPNTTRRAALRDVVRHVYLTGKHNFAGVAEGYLGLIGLPRGGEPPTVAGRTIGYDAFRALRDGDVIVGIRVPARGDAAVNVTNMQALILALQRARPGDWVRLRVLRDGASLDVDVRVGPRTPAILAAEGGNPAQTEADQYWQREFAPVLATPATTRAIS